MGLNGLLQGKLYFLIINKERVSSQLPADALGTLSCKPSNFRKRVRKVINRAK
jgi:hypothetical protein